jgi:hypothetical protein
MRAPVLGGFPATGNLERAILHPDTLHFEGVPIVP